MHSLRFVFGPSGSGKSTAIYREILQRAGEHPETNFFIIVPDQFTMQTQQQLVKMSPGGGILNIDVLSFGRLTHRILEEVGYEQLPVLDDTGKCLVLQRVAAQEEGRCPVLGAQMSRQGYIHEVKSILSEFMQYGYAPDDLERLMGASRPALAAKLKDLQTLYRGFQSFINGHFITTEGRLDVLRQALPSSRILPGSVIVFDGFTGFTPIQMRVIEDLMEIAGETVLTFALSEGEDPFSEAQPQDLFYLTHRTVAALCAFAQRRGIERGEDLVCNLRNRRPDLEYLERHLFRYGAGHARPYPDRPEGVSLTEYADPAREVRGAGLEIVRLIREQGLSYRDIAVILGDLDGYAPYIEREFAKLGIPYYLDRTSAVRLSPLVEALLGAFEMPEKDFSPDSVVRYLRSGLSGISMEEADLLEDYIRKAGIRHAGMYRQLFARIPKGTRGEADLAPVNAIRGRLMEELGPVLELTGKRTAAEFAGGALRFLEGLRAGERLLSMSERFGEQGDLRREQEYARIYELVCHLLEQIHDLLGEETLTRKEFTQILEAGFAEIRVGSLPQNVDRVTVGDMERTRLCPVKALLFLGVNDGNIPRSASSGGILSELDRELLSEQGEELSPTPRELMYTQRLYLYLNMTKPSESLYLSYVRSGAGGESLRPSYLAEVVKKCFPKMKVRDPEAVSSFARIAGERDGLDVLAAGLQEYADGQAPDADGCFDGLYALYSVYGSRPELRERLRDAAFARYLDLPIREETARSLYGERMRVSVSSLEEYAKCAYAYFLKYGLGLREQPVYEVNAADRGSVLHSVLCLFFRELEAEGISLNAFEEARAAADLHRILERESERYGAAVYYDTARSSYRIRQYERILLRTVLTLRDHLKAGAFVPETFEKRFRSELVPETGAREGEQARVLLEGIIDRVDLARVGDHTYVKVLDYKSGDQKFDLGRLVSGRTMQLPLYLEREVALRQQEAGAGQVSPAAMLYFHVDDPLTEISPDVSPEGLREKQRREYRMRGAVSLDGEVLGLLDHALEGMNPGADSEIVPVTLKKDGTPNGYSWAFPPEDLQLLLRYGVYKARSQAGEILKGRITMDPWEKGSCDYCPYRGSCGMDPKLPGTLRRKEEKTDREEALARMRKELGE
ncbi:MAG: exodeoxyribonuclease V subunit gamma [Lachnospiraceae bacterium]|nr:exodeoxyribonuclease V subunit gamma [Lachnospiraceae bacterium]